jgi:protein-disulfide isomerase
MHDQLYQNQDAWSESKSAKGFFDNYAKAIGLNIDTFNKDFASSAVNNAINADLSAFDKTGDTKATPTFYLNGEKIDLGDLVDNTNQPTLENFSKLIDAALAKAN